MHIIAVNSCRTWYCLCVILCAFVLVVSSFGPLVLPYFPLWKLLTDTGLKESVEWQSLGSSAQQYGIFSRLHYIGNIGPEYKWYPSWIGCQHQVYISATFTTVIIESARRQILCQSIVHFVSKVWFIYTVWVCYEYNLNPAMSSNQARMCYECGVQQEG